MSVRRVVGLAVVCLICAPVAEHAANARELTGPQRSFARGAHRPVGESAAAPASPHGAPRFAETPRVPGPVERCRPMGSNLGELSGLASDGDAWYAVNDGGSSLRVYVLDPEDCSVREVRGSGTDPYDVEDLALADDGTLWLADTGDNAMRRDTVALHAMPSEGGSTLYRLRYPDRPHDAEALVLDPSGRPYIITKESFGAAQVYRPAGPLLPGGTTDLRHVGSITLPGTGTPGGPFSGGLGSALVTGAAMNHEGDVVAVRTYTDAFLFPAPDGDVVRALRRTPSVVPLPNEPQGEAIAWEPDGTLLSGSEGTRQPVRAVPKAVSKAIRERAADTPVTTERSSGGDSRGGNATERPPGSTGRTGLSAGQSLALAGGVAALALAVFGAIRRRRSQ